MLRQEPLLLGSILLGILFNILFYGKTVGISYPIFVIGVILLLIYMMKLANVLKKSYYWLITVPIILLSFKTFLSDNYFFQFFNGKIVIILFVSMSLLLVGKEIYKIDSFSFLFKIFKALLFPLRYFSKPYSFVYDKIKIEKKTGMNSQTKKILIGLLISLPILAVITGLLSSADMVFNEMIRYFPSKFTTFLEDMNLTNYIGQMVLVLLISTYTYAYGWNLFMPLVDRKASPNVPNLNTMEGHEGSSKSKRTIDGTILITIILMINLVYLVFCTIQFSYLFNGGFNTLPGNFTYAEYARQGFFQLLLVTLLNFIIILFSLHFIEANNNTFKWVQRLLILMGIFTYIMIYSSFYRMGLYSDNYGYTYLRIFVYFFLFLEVPLLGITLTYIQKPSFNLIRIYIITGLIFYIGLNYINVDEMIARNNVDRYFETGKIDMRYLMGLSADAVPELTRLLNAKDISIIEPIKNHLQHRASILNVDKPSWQEFNYSRHKAGQILNNVSYH